MVKLLWLEGGMAHPVVNCCATLECCARACRGTCVYVRMCVIHYCYSRSKTD
jgi:hypothetical protein